MQALGYEFRDPEWLALALTHRSVSGSRNNESGEHSKGHGSTVLMMA